MANIFFFLLFFFSFLLLKYVVLIGIVCIWTSLFMYVMQRDVT